MLKALSFTNITLATLYFLFFLLNSTSYLMIGIFVVIAFSGLVIRNLEKDQEFGAIHYILGLLALFFAIFLIIGTFNVISSSLAYHYFGNSWLYILLTTLFIAGIIVQFILLIKSSFLKA